MVSKQCNSIKNYNVLWINCMWQLSFHYQKSAIRALSVLGGDGHAVHEGADSPTTSCRNDRGRHRRDVLVKCRIHSVDAVDQSNRLSDVFRLNVGLNSTGKCLLLKLLLLTSGTETLEIWLRHSNTFVCNSKLLCCCDTTLIYWPIFNTFILFNFRQ